MNYQIYNNNPICANYRVDNRQNTIKYSEIDIENIVMSNDVLKQENEELKELCIYLDEERERLQNLLEEHQKYAKTFFTTLQSNMDSVQRELREDSSRRTGDGSSSSPSSSIFKTDDFNINKNIISNNNMNNFVPNNANNNNQDQKATISLNKIMHQLPQHFNSTLPKNNNNNNNDFYNNNNNNIANDSNINFYDNSNKNLIDKMKKITSFTYLPTDNNNDHNGNLIHSKQKMNNNNNMNKLMSKSNPLLNKIATFNENVEMDENVDNKKYHHYNYQPTDQQQELFQQKQQPRNPFFQHNLSQQQPYPSYNPLPTSNNILQYNQQPYNTSQPKYQQKKSIQQYNQQQPLQQYTTQQPQKYYNSQQQQYIKPYQGKQTPTPKQSHIPKAQFINNNTPQQNISILPAYNTSSNNNLNNKYQNIKTNNINPTIKYDTNRSNQHNIGDVNSNNTTPENYSSANSSNRNIGRREEEKMRLRQSCNALWKEMNHQNSSGYRF